MSNVLEQLLGPTLYTKDGNNNNKPTLQVLGGDCHAVGIYFSAHWCPPCKQFTPFLPQTHKELRKRKKKMEIVFCSFDQDRIDFNLNFKNNPKNPWMTMAIPFEDRERKVNLSQKYNVSDIPTLVVIDSQTGETITIKGRSAAASETTTAQPTIPESLGQTFVKNNISEAISAASLKDKYLGLYFSSHWCGPCRTLTPKLISMYNKMKEERSVDNNNFEIIFISSDRDETSFQEYFSEMPWLALPFSDRAAKNDISDRFGIAGIPSLVILGPEEEDANGKTDRKVINDNARGLVGNDPNGLEFPWHPPIFSKLEDANFLGESPTVIVLGEGCDDDDIEEMKTELELASKKISTTTTDNIKFAYADLGDKLADQIRALTKIGPPTDQVDVLLLDVRDHGGFYVGTKDAASADDIAKFVADFKAKKIPRQQM